MKKLFFSVMALAAFSFGFAQKKADEKGHLFQGTPIHQPSLPRKPGASVRYKFDISMPLKGNEVTTSNKIEKADPAALYKAIVTNGDAVRSVLQ